MPYDPNKKYYETEGVPEYEGQDTGLLKAEEVILSSLRDEIKDKPILDLGVGAGRTTPYLRAISKHYIGADYSAKMIDLCRERNSEATLVVCDAREMPMFEDETFAAVLFLGAGMGAAIPPGRSRVLKEVYRVLSSDGVFVFPAQNIEDKDVYSFSGFSPAPRRVAYIKDNATRLKAYTAAQIIRLWNRVHQKGYAVVPEYDYVTGEILPLYYISKDAQVKQLLSAGFRRVEAFDMEGIPINGAKQVKDYWVYYIARKQ